MKTQYKTVIGLFFLTSILLYACKEKEEDKTPEPENKIVALFKAHSWKINDELFLRKNDTLFTYMVPACLLDDKLDYLSSDLYVKDPGTELCSGQVQKKDTLGWRLLENNTILEINNKGTIVKNNILSISTDSLMTQTVSPNGDTLVYLYLKY